MGFVFGPQNDNSWNYVKAHNMFTDLCCTYLLSWTWYSCSVNLRLLSHFLCFPLSINSCERVESEIYFLKYPCYTHVFITNCDMHEHLWVVSVITSKLHICHQYFKKPFVRSVQTIYNIFSMSRCSNITIK